jgi:hypothetical protein
MLPVSIGVEDSINVQGNSGITVILLLSRRSGMWIVLKTSREFSLLHSQTCQQTRPSYLQTSTIYQIKPKDKKNRNVTSFLFDVLQESNRYTSSHGIHTMPVYPPTSPKYKPLLIVPNKWRGRHITCGRKIKRRLYFIPQWHNIYTKFR